MALMPASELAVQIVSYLVTTLLPPQALPKLSFTMASRMSGGRSWSCQKS